MPHPTFRGTLGSASNLAKHREKDRDMNRYDNHVIAYERIAELLREAEENRLARTARRPRAGAPGRRLSLRQLVARLSPA
jgi:hypothetical protein